MQTTDNFMLQLFTDYGRLLQNEDGGKAFQKLLFLIRDWQFDDEHPFGLAGGQEVVDNSLEVSI